MPFLTSALIAGGIAAAGSIGAGAIGANAAGNAANAQTNAANHAADIQQADANAALNFNEQQLNLAEQNTATTRAAGQNATIALNDLMGLTPLAPQPINAGGNVAPQAAGINGSSSPGAIASPGVSANGLPPAYPGAPTGSTIGRAKGGPTKIGLHYLVGEKGPEELVMHPDGTGHVIPRVVSPRSQLIPRAGRRRDMFDACSPATVGTGRVAQITAGQ